MNVGPSDILKGIQLAVKIYDLGFVDENSADKLYQAFHEDINQFQSLLAKLSDSIIKAQDRYRNRGPNLRGPHPYDPRSEEFEKERKAIVGPFLTTLKDCQKLLDANRAYRAEVGRRTNPAQNLQWNLSRQDRVEGLRRRLQFHSEKIRFVIDRLSLDLLTDLDERVDDLHALAEQNVELSGDILFELNKFRSSLFGFLAGQGTLEQLSLDVPHIASDAVAARFADGLSVNAPSGGIGGGGIPLVEGFDALLTLFQQSVSSSEPTPERYLLFLKVRWVLARIKDSREYRDARPGLYYKRAVHQIEAAMSAKARRPDDLVPYDEAALMDLSDGFFQIWPQPASADTVTSRQLDQLLPRANEQQIARVELAPTGSYGIAFATIFKKSQTHFRLVQELTSSLSNQKIIIPQQVDTTQRKMIPRYALPTLETPCLEIALFSSNEEDLYTFTSVPDLWKFQAALTGYEVSFDQMERNIQCQFSEEVKSLDCLARLQIWQDPIVLAPAIDTSAMYSMSSSSSISGGAHSRRDSLTSTIAPTANISRTPGGWQAGPSKSSFITLFTQIVVKKMTRFAIISMELQEGVYLRPHECSCHLNYENCSKLVLAGLGKRKLPVHVRYSGTDAEGQPDPNSFDLFPFRHPQKSDTSTKYTEYLVLKFKTLEEKRRMDKELELRFKIRDKQIAEQRITLSGIQHRQNRPERRDRITPQNNISDAPVRRSFTTSSLPPQLELPDTGPALEDVIVDQPGIPSLSTSPNTISSTGSPLSPATSVDDSHAGHTVFTRTLTQSPPARSSLLTAWRMRASESGASRPSPTNRSLLRKLP